MFECSFYENILDQKICLTLNFVYRILESRVPTHQ